MNMTYYEALRESVKRKKSSHTNTRDIEKNNSTEFKRCAPNAFLWRQSFLTDSPHQENFLFLVSYLS